MTKRPLKPVITFEESFYALQEEIQEIKEAIQTILATLQALMEEEEMVSDAEPEDQGSDYA